ncbi:MAG: Rid family detoxifying hydrolase [Bacteroidota bacterium]
MKKQISISGAPAPIGPYSQAILKGETLFVSGQIPIDPMSAQLVNDSIESATAQVLKNIAALLKEANFSKDDIVKCSIFLKDMNDFAKMNEVYASFFQGIIPPARETVQVVKLPMDVLVEISCIAIKN